MLSLELMHPEEAKFITEIRSDVYSDDPRLIYSDWLDDRQDERANYIRAEVNFANVDPYGDEARIEFDGLKQMIAQRRFCWSWRKEIGVLFDYVRTVHSEWTQDQELPMTITQAATLTMLYEYPNQFGRNSEFAILKHQPDKPLPSCLSQWRVPRDEKMS